MCGNENGIRLGFLGLVILRRFCFVEQAGLFMQYISVLLAGLTEPGSLRIEQKTAIRKGKPKDLF